MNVWKCCVFPSSSSAARSEHPQLQQGTVVSCQCTHNQIFISRDEEKREGRRSKHEKYNKTEEKKKEFGNWWRVREEEANRKKILYAVECLSYQGGWLREWAKRIRGHDGENVRRQISQKYKENETEAAAWCGKKKIADQSEAAGMRSDRRDDKRQRRDIRESCRFLWRSHGLISDGGMRSCSETREASETRGCWWRAEVEVKC